jgi:two-component system, sensor histidine kinase LadS
MRWIDTVLRCLIVAASLIGGSALAAISLLPATPDGALGAHTSWMKEAGAPLSFADAASARAAGRFSAATTPILAFGIGSAPVWIHLAVDNAASRPLTRRLLIENAWQDRIDIHFVSPDGAVQAQQVGDTLPHASRPVASRYFALDHDFQPGTTDVYLRVESADPIVLPIFLNTPEAIAEREHRQGYRYGFLYGYLLALLAYNLLLYAALRDERQFAYAAYIAMFIVTNIAYTGHGFAHHWAEATGLQRWIIPTLMMAFSLAGLVFARHFLDTPTHFPRADRAMRWGAGAFVAFYAAAMLFLESQAGAILVAFAATTLFSFGMPALGMLAAIGRHPYSRYFLFATLASAIGTAVTSLAVLGLIDYSDLRYRAVEVGMLIDATLLALALGNQFRSLKTERAEAQQLAEHDPLTNLFNRRAFLERARPLWSAARRHEHELSLIMVDIDRFKTINDTHGHAAGDDAILAVADALRAAVRSEDVVARWGGEEFIVLLPQTSLDAAIGLAERLRCGIEALCLPMAGGEVRFTVSLGVASSTGKESLDRLITEADHFLYQAKHHGRNRVGSPLVATEGGGSAA